MLLLPLYHEDFFLLLIPAGLPQAVAPHLSPVTALYSSHGDLEEVIKSLADVVTALQRLPPSVGVRVSRRPLQLQQVPPGPSATSCLHPKPCNSLSLRGGALSYGRTTNRASFASCILRGPPGPINHCNYY